MNTTYAYPSYHRLFATVFSYPMPDYKEAVNRLAESPILSPEVSHLLSEFRESVTDLNLTKLEEIFTYTFDLNPGCCLELGWHLYGESYKRGEFLVKMRQYLRNYGISESAELPDHLSHCLRVLEMLKDEEAETFTRTYVFPAIEKIKNAFPENNPFGAGIQALQTYLIKKYSLNEEQK